MTADELAARRQVILRRFETWLDETLAAEEPPAGIAAAIFAELESDGGVLKGGADLYALHSAMTALTGEVKLQGRAFKELHQTLATRLEEGGRAEKKGRQETIAVLLDLRDRLGRGVERAEAHLEWIKKARSKKKKRRKREKRILAATVALVKGCTLNVERLDDALDDVGVRELNCEGRPFDPHTMRAIEIEETSRVAEGEVLEVYRAGFECNGEILRPAEVKVARTKQTRSTA